MFALHTEQEQFETETRKMKQQSYAKQTGLITNSTSATFAFDAPLLKPEIPANNLLCRINICLQFTST